jgi:protein-tyrosine-phosphatase
MVQTPAPLDRPPGAVLFACNYNRVRSPIAEGLLRQLMGDRMFVDSCGLKRAPGDEEAEAEAEAEGPGIDPLAIEVMAEIGCDISGCRPKTFDELEDDSFDLVISLTPEAQHRAVELARGRAAEIEYWPTTDPTLAEGSRETKLSVYRELRDALARLIQQRFRP